MRVRGRTRSGHASRSASRSGCDSDSHGHRSDARRSGKRLNSLGQSLNFGSSRAGGFSVDIDHGVIDFAANDVFLEIGKRCSICYAEGGEGDKCCGGGEMHDGEDSGEVITARMGRKAKMKYDNRRIEMVGCWNREKDQGVSSMQCWFGLSSVGR